MPTGDHGSSAGDASSKRAQDSHRRRRRCGRRRRRARPSSCSRRCPAPPGRPRRPRRPRHHRLPARAIRGGRRRGPSAGRGDGPGQAPRRLDAGHGPLGRPAAPGPGHAVRRPTRTETATATPTSRSSPPIVDALHAAGISIILTPLDTPRWASDEEWWLRPPSGYEKGKYYPFYAPDMANLTVKQQFGALGKFLAGRFAGQGALLRVLERAQPGLLPVPAVAGQRHERRRRRRTSRCSRRGTRASRGAPPPRSSSAEPRRRAAEATS